jgi:NNP family nitrate/nitrite transporter-like MFS transporter
MDKSSKPSDAHGGEKNPENSFFNKLGALLILTSIFFFNFVSRITPAPLIPRMGKDLNLTHADAGTLFFMISLGYFITLIGSGFVSSRFNHKRTIIISDTTLGFALIGTSFCTGPWTLRLGLFVVGMASGLYLPSAIATLTALIPSRHWGKALAIHDIAPNLSFVAAPLICEAVLVWFSWRMVFLLIGFGALIMSPVFANYGGGGEFKGEAPNFAAFQQLFGNLSVWVMVFLFSLGVISTMGIYTMLPLYLVAEHGMDINLANTLVALSRIPSIIIVFFGGWATIPFAYKLHCIFAAAGGRMFFSRRICSDVFNCARPIKEHSCFTHHSAGYCHRRRPGSGFYRFHRRYGQLRSCNHDLWWTDYRRIGFYRCAKIL